MLTTHRMDEAEALCDRIAIMINGRFVCLGSPGHLKQKYGHGYQLNVTVTQRESLDKVHEIIQREIPGSIRDIAAN